MSAGDIIRNPHEIQEFLDSVVEYEQQIKTICSRIHRGLDNATGAMLDETGLAALTTLSDLVYEILTALPNADTLQLKLRKVPKYGKKYLETEPDELDRLARELGSDFQKIYEATERMSKYLKYGRINFRDLVYGEMRNCVAKIQGLLSEALSEVNIVANKLILQANSIRRQTGPLEADI